MNDDQLRQSRISDDGTLEYAGPTTWDGEPIYSTATVAEGLFDPQAFQQMPGQLAIEDESCRIATNEAIPQLATDLQRRVARHLETRPGFSTTDRLFSELYGGHFTGIDRARRDATKRQLTSALRRLQAIGYIRYDSEHGGWWR